MTIDQDKILPVPGVTPSAMTPELRSRLLSAMQEAGDETREFMHEESLLRCLAPAPMPGVVRSRVGVRMHLNALNVRRSLRYGTTRGWRRVAAAAALLALCCTGGGWVLVSDAVADTASNQGVVSRSIIETRGGDTVRWGADAVPVHCYEVTYEDTFVMDAESDMRVMVSVPNRTEVIVPADVL
ncbi:MAG: hypothetical protein IJE66_04310 [Akkermansia sp.]|nr:hypothetical protein [Akkermansia sp.]